MVVAAESVTEQWDVFYKILSLGIIGLAFLLAWLAYRLLKREQERRTPSPGILKTVRAYMVFSFCLALLGLVGEGFKLMDQKEQIKKLATEKSDLQGEVVTLTKNNHSLQTTNDAYTRLGEVWTIKGKYTIGTETPVVSDTEIEVTAHPPLVVIDPDVSSFTARIFVPRKAAGELDFPDLKVGRPVKRQFCTIHFDWKDGKLVDGKINESADIIPISYAADNHEVEMGKAINLPEFTRPEAGPVVRTEVSKVGEVVGANIH